MRLAAALLLAALPFAPPPAIAQEAPVAVQLVDALEGVFGTLAGQRRSHARGFCAVGEWHATGAGETLSNAASLRRDLRAPVLARFSVGGGNPRAPENAPSVRGLSFGIQLPGGAGHEFVLINTPVFTAQTPESFVRYLRVRAPDPATRQMNAQAVAAANAANPDWQPQIAYLRDTPPPASFATAPYYGVNSFLFSTASGERRPARWTFEPVAGRQGLTQAEREARGPVFLEGELRERLARGPAEWRVMLQIPAAGDPITNAVAAWPADRPTIEVARLRITALAPEQACAGHSFNPVLLPDGIEPSEDPILLARPEVYAISLTRRSN
jgi:catalase